MLFVSTAAPRQTSIIAVECSSKLLASRQITCIFCPCSRFEPKTPFFRARRNWPLKPNFHDWLSLYYSTWCFSGRLKENNEGLIVGGFESVTHPFCFQRTLEQASDM